MFILQKGFFFKTILMQNLHLSQSIFKSFIYFGKTNVNLIIDIKQEF